MKIEARVPLTLPKVKTTIVVSYNTYEKATWDQYLAASIVDSATSEGEAVLFVDEITGKGSLNCHFKKLLDEVQKKDIDTRDKILNENLYPFTKIDETNSFDYYPSLNVSVYSTKIHEGNLSDYSREVLKTLLNIQDDIIDIQFEPQEDSLQDTYSIKFEDDVLEICIDKQNWRPLSPELFNQLYRTDLSNIEKYKGSIKRTGEGNRWFELTNRVLDSLCDDKFCYYDEEGDHVSIGDSLEKTQIINVYGLYFYRRTKVDYSGKNGDKCQRALEHLLRNDLLFDFPQKSLVKLTRSVKNHSQQDVVNYVLSRRYDSDMAEIGANLISHGVTEGWGKEALLSIKKESKGSLTALYKISSDLDYTDAELSTIDSKVLSIEHKERVKAYKANRDAIIKEIRGIIGEITSSGIRQRMKSLKKTDMTKKLTEELNRYVGHQKDDISKYTGSELDDYLSKVKVMYQHYIEVKKLLDKKGLNK
jgi:hypothetical protein